MSPHIPKLHKKIHCANQDPHDPQFLPSSSSPNKSRPLPHQLHTISTRKHTPKSQPYTTPITTPPQLNNYSPFNSTTPTSFDNHIPQLALIHPHTPTPTPIHPIEIRITLQRPNHATIDSVFQYLHHRDNRIPP